MQRAVVQLRELNRFSGDLYTGIAPSTLQTEMDGADERPDIDPILNPEIYGINTESLSVRDVDDADGHPHSVASNMCDAGISDQGMISAISRLTMSDCEYEGKVKSLNASQQEAFKLVVQYTRERVAHTQNPKHVGAPEPLRIFLTGGAGTGKSDTGACRACTHRLKACMPCSGTYWCSSIQYPGSNAAQSISATS